MRVRTSLLIALALLPACRSREDKTAEADARAVRAGFHPPTVTSRLEYGSEIERRFHRLDRNHDGRITPDELPRPGSPVMSWDRNGDGAVTAGEFSNGALARFDRQDLNRDGSVTSEERATAKAQGK